MAFNILILLIISFGLCSVLSEEQDDLCPPTNTILCVKDVLLDISNAAKEIHSISEKIEQLIYTNEPTRATLDNSINRQLEYIRSNLSSKHHYQMMNINNNINRTGLIDLIEEEYYAFGYLYNSIEKFPKLVPTVGKSADKSFKKIRNILKKNILCNYRNILHVYSVVWLSIDQIDGIRIFKTHKRASSSFVHHSYSITLCRLLQEWVKHINDFVLNIETKL